MFRSLNSRLLLSYTVVILVCLALVGLGLLVFVRSSPLWTQAAMIRLDVVARATLPALLPDGASGSLRDWLAQVAEEQQVRVLILDDGGTVRFDSDGGWEGERLDGFRRAPGVPGRTRGTFVAPSGGRWAFVGQVVPMSAQKRQTILFVSPQGRLQMLVWFVENLLPPLTRAGGVALVLSALLALLISRSIATPLRRVAGAAEGIAEGRTGTRALISGPSEVQALARSFNTMSERVEAAQRSQRDFVANVSHELKTPLTSIQGFSQALLDGTVAEPEARKRAARIIHGEAERMHRMADELLTLARFDAGQMVMARDRVELNPLLRGCIEKLTPQAQAREVFLELEIPVSLHTTGDTDRLAQVFTNLLDNGIMHTRAGGKVMVMGREMNDGHGVELTVTDNGTGIANEKLQRIFERFYQVEPSRRRSRGAGLGLAITREIIEAHGGTVTAESVEGLGSRFTVRLSA